jgi:hypothetical protein
MGGSTSSEHTRDDLQIACIRHMEKFVQQHKRKGGQEVPLHPKRCDSKSLGPFASSSRVTRGQTPASRHDCNIETIAINTNVGLYYARFRDDASGPPIWLTALSNRASMWALTRGAMRFPVCCGIRIVGER